MLLQVQTHARPFLPQQCITPQSQVVPLANAKEFRSNEIGWQEIIPNSQEGNQQHAISQVSSQESKKKLITKILV